MAGVLVDGWGTAVLGAAGADVALVAWTTVKGAATDSDLSVLLEECDRSASQFECESCHSSSAMLIKAKGVKAGSRPAFCLVSNPLEGRFSNAQAERAAAIKSRTR